MARSKTGEGADLEVDPSRDGPPATDGSRRDGAWKYVEDVVEGQGRGSWGVCLGAVLAIFEDPRSNGVEKGRWHPAAGYKTVLLL